MRFPLSLEHMKIRDELAGDEGAIRNVVSEAFGRIQEAGLVDALRQNGDLFISLVAEIDGRIEGHVALSRLKSPPRSLALAPVSVASAAQRRGIGSALVRASIELARQRDSEFIFVLGDAAYYSRFGFSADTAKLFRCQYVGPHFMALRLSDGTATAAAPAVYADTFADLA